MAGGEAVDDLRVLEPDEGRVQTLGRAEHRQRPAGATDGWVVGFVVCPLLRRVFRYLSQFRDPPRKRQGNIIRRSYPTLREVLVWT